MAFIKRIIVDRNVVGGQRYTMTTLGDGRVEIVPTPDSIIEAGTQINADLLQRYEDFLEELQGHVDNTSNPHGVTKAQVGLSNVPNVNATNATNITSGTLNKNRLPSDIPQANIVGLVAALNDAANHIAATNNPHGVTKAQVGLSNVKNVDTTIASNITSGKLPVAQVPTGIPRANITGLTDLFNNHNGLANTVQNHIEDSANPHGVTKAQVGLGNVMDYPIATTEQADAGSTNLAYMTPSRTTRLLRSAAFISGINFVYTGNITVQPSMINEMVMVDPNDTTTEKTITINTSLNTLSVGSQIHFLRYGGAEARFVAGTGVALVSDGFKRRIAGRYQMVTLLKISSNTWLLVGALKV